MLVPLKQLALVPEKGLPLVLRFVTFAVVDFVMFVSKSCSLSVDPFCSSHEGLLNMNSAVEPEPQDKLGKNLRRRTCLVTAG